MFPGCMVDFHEEITILFSKRNSGWVHELVKQSLKTWTTRERVRGLNDMDVKCPLGHLCSVYSV